MTLLQTNALLREIPAKVVQIETSLSPIELLDRLQAIEKGHGRVKLIDKGPRNIDLDIAIFRDEIVDSERLTVPHMLMHEREFVLRPIMECVQVIVWTVHMTDQFLASGTSSRVPIPVPSRPTPKHTRIC